jgi:hypothetical protein
LIRKSCFSHRLSIGSEGVKRFAKVGLVLTACLLAFFLVTRLTGSGAAANARKEHASASFSFGKTESHNNSFSGSSYSSSDNSAFSSRRVIFVQTKSHPLSERIGALVAERLKDCPGIDRFEIVEPSAMLTEGMAAPDLFLRLDLIELKEEGLLSRSTKTTVTAFLGSAPWQSSHHNQGPSTPPLVQFAWNATFASDATFRGIRSDRYGELARSIADDCAKGISNQIAALSTKFPALPDLPPDFFGPYQPVEDFQFLKEVKAARACSYYGLMTHNQTFWKFQTATNPVPQLERIISQLQATQWKVGTVSVTNTEDYFVSAGRDHAELEIFRVRPYGMGLSSPEKPLTSVEFVVHYQKPFSREKLETALEQLFVEQRPLETLLPFQNAFSRDQRERFYALVEKSPATSPQACIQIAESYLNRKQTNAALNLLLRAKALAVAAIDPSEVESRVEALAKKISAKEKLDLKVTSEICRELGFIELTNGLQAVEQERALGQPLLMFGVNERGLKTFALTIRSPQKGVYPWTMVQIEGFGRSTSSSSFDLKQQKQWQHTFTFDELTLKATGSPLSDDRRVKFIVGLERR